MKYLKIDNNKGFYKIETSSDSWMEIDKITKDHLLILLDHAMTSDFEMDIYDNELIANPAHNIIYRHVFQKFNDFLENKTRFNDSVDILYKDALEKYKIE